MPVAYPKSSASQNRVLLITVVVPVRNEERHIAATLAGILGQDYPPDAFEVFVVDGNSTDRTRAIVEQMATGDERVTLHANPKQLSSAARNIGSKAARGDVVLIIDGHCQFDDDQYLRHVSDAFTRTQADCLGRPQPLDIPDGTLLQRVISVARASRLGHHPDSYIYADQELVVPAHSVGVAYRREVFETAGFFDETFDACEDVEFNHRVDKAGLKCVLAPKIRLRYRPRSSVVGLWYQMFRYGKGRARLCRKHFETFSLKSFAPAAFALFLIAGLPLAFAVPGFGVLYVGVLGLYLAIVMLFAGVLAVREGSLAMLWLLPVIFATIHLGAGFGSLHEVIFGPLAFQRKLTP